MEEQKTEFIVRKKDKTENFSIIYNACLRDNSISWQAKGLFGYLMTLPNDWEIYKTELPNHASNGRDATIKAFDELIEKGYITVEETKGENGKFGKKIYKVFEVSQGETKIIRKKRNADKKEAPLLNNRYLDTVTGNPLTVNQELLNTDIQNTNKLKTNTKFSESDDSDFPEDPNEIKTKKVIRSKKTNTQQYEEYISSLTDTEREQSAKCVDLFIELHKQIDPYYNRDKSRLCWQVEFAKFQRESHRSYVQILQVIRSAMTNPYRNDHIYKPEYIFNNFEDIVQSLNKTNPKSDYQKKRDGAIERSNMITDDDEYKLF